MSEQTRADTVGVLGGMGPLATVDFLSRLIDVSGAQNDAEHVPVVVSSEPQIPSRPRAFKTEARAAMLMECWPLLSAVPRP